MNPTLIRRDPSLSVRAAIAARLSNAKRDRLAYVLYSSPEPAMAEERNTTAYLRIAATARMHGH